MSWRERLDSVVESVKDFFTERDVEHCPFQEPEASGSNSSGREEVRPEEPSVLFIEDQPENQHYLDPAQAANFIGEETEAYARPVLDPDPNPPLKWNAEQTDAIKRIPDLEDIPVEQLGEEDLLVLAHIAEFHVPDTGPDSLSETDWRIEEDGSESKVHIGQDEHGYYYAVERSPAHDEEDDLRWQGPYPTEDEAACAAYDGEHQADEKSSSFGKQEQAVLSIPEAQNSQVLDEVPGSGEQAQEEPSR